MVSSFICGYYPSLPHWLWLLGKLWQYTNLAKNIFIHFLCNHFCFEAALVILTHLLQSNESNIFHNNELRVAATIEFQWKMHLKTENASPDKKKFWKYFICCSDLFHTNGNQVSSRPQNSSIIPFLQAHLPLQGNQALWRIFLININCILSGA